MRRTMRPSAALPRWLSSAFIPAAIPMLSMLISHLTAPPLPILCFYAYLTHRFSSLLSLFSPLHFYMLASPLLSCRFSCLFPRSIILRFCFRDPPSGLSSTTLRPCSVFARSYSHSESGVSLSLVLCSASLLSLCVSRSFSLG